VAIVRSKDPEVTITAQNWWKYLPPGLFGLIAIIVGARTGDVRLIILQMAVIGMLGFYALKRHTLDRFLRLERTHRWWGTVGAWTATTLALLGLPVPIPYILDYAAASKYLDYLNTLDSVNHALAILLAGSLLFAFRFRARLMYGIAEVMAGCYIGGQKLSSWHDGQLASLGRGLK
jgi:hypothetical protein